MNWNTVKRNPTLIGLLLLVPCLVLSAPSPGPDQGRDPDAGATEAPGAAAPTEADDWLPPMPDIYAVLDELDCAGVAGLCQEVVPGLFFDSRPDSLLDLLQYWQESCGTSEPLQRVLILGAVWDGAFSEQIYGQDIMDHLLWYADPVRLEDHRHDFRPGLASGGVASEADFTPQRPAFDAFTESLADQLLPHVPQATPQHFFCLYYAGLRDQAWNLLRDNRLNGTYLQRAYNWELERSRLERAPMSVAFAASYWRPEGNLARAGQHLGVGAVFEKRPGAFFYRVTGDLLIGRSRYPYVVQKDDFTEWSNRFNTVTLGFEAGGTVLQRDRVKLDLFAGFGLGGTVPFMDEEKGEDVTGTVLIHSLAQAGLGVRFPVDGHGRWTMGCDLSRQWLNDRNDGGTPLDGRAWQVRVVFSRNANHDLDRRLRLLGQ